MTIFFTCAAAAAAKSDSAQHKTTDGRYMLPIDRMNAVPHAPGLITWCPYRLVDRLLNV